jgi:hypothetical protein
MSPTGLPATTSLLLSLFPSFAGIRRNPFENCRSSYPSQYISQFTMKDGSEVTLRPIRPEDEPLMSKFHETLSERSV